MKRERNVVAQDIEPSVFFVSTFLRQNIKAYHKGDTKAKRFLFEGRILRNFVENLGFKKINLDILRHRIVKGDKLSDIF